LIRFRTRNPVESVRAVARDVAKKVPTSSPAIAVANARKKVFIYVAKV
jgi:hypothetical protein